MVPLVESGWLTGQLLQAEPQASSWCVAGYVACRMAGEWKLESSCHVKKSNPSLVWVHFRIRTQLLLFENYLFLDMSECSSQPCQNGGTCVEGVSQYKCICPPGKTGSHCQHQAQTGTWPLWGWVRTFHCRERSSLVTGHHTQMCQELSSPPESGLSVP